MKRIVLSLLVIFSLLGMTVLGCNGGGDGNGENGYIPPPPAPAAFSLSNLSIEPTEILANETVSITVTVANTGGSQGSHNVALNIDGIQEETKTVTLAAGASESVTFSVTREDAGTCAVAIDNLSGSFTVVMIMAAEDIAEATILANAELNTYIFDADIEMTTTMSGETPISVTYDMTGTVNYPDQEMYTDTTVIMSMPPETMEMSVEMYIIGDWIYMKTDMLGFATEWMKMQLAEAEMELMWEEQDIVSQQQDLLIGFSEVELMGTEIVDGVECYKLLVKPDMDKFLGLAGALGDLEEIEGLDPEDVITDFSMTEWIAKDTYITIKSIVELTMSVDEATIYMKITTLIRGIGEPVTIELPPEAEAAEDVTP